MNKSDPSGKTCTKTEKGSEDCHIDQVIGHPTKKQQAEIQAFNKSYTDAVNNLAADPKGQTTVEMPVYGPNGNPTGKFRSATVNSGELANALEGRTFVADFASNGGTAGANTNRNITTVFEGGLKGPKGYGEPCSLTRDQKRQVVIAHEGMHGSGTYTDDYLAPGGSSVMGLEPWASGHQEPYNQGAMDLLGIPY